MHRHGYKGTKFNRERDQREALIQSLAEALIIHESIETTLPKAKEVLVYTEKLVTKAKGGSLHDRRQIISKLQTKNAANKLVDELAPKLASRNSGHLRVERTRLRRGDNAQMAKISFIFDEKSKAAEAKLTDEIKKTPSKKPVAKKAVVNTESKKDK